MAVKFSQFTPETVAANVTEIVGYTATGDLNVRIPPANLDTLVTSDTAQVGTSATYTLSGTKTGTSTTTDLTTYTVPANSGMALTAGTNTIAFDATSYSLASTDSVVGNNSVPVNLTGTGGGDSGVDTVTIVGTGTVQVSSATNTITIDGSGGGGGVTSVGLTETGSALNITGSPITGSGTFNIAGAGTSSQVILGDLSLATLPTDTNTTYTIGTSTNGSSVDVNLDASIGTDSNIKLTPAGGITITEAAGVITLDTSASGSGTVTSVGSGDSNTILIGGTAADPTVAAITAAGVGTGLLNLATGGQIQTAINSAIAGGVTFKGGFNANSGAIDGGSNNLTTGGARVEISVGDLYVVTTAGNFYGDATVPLAIGDQVLCKTAAAAGASVIGDWNTIESNVVPATAGVTDASTVKGVAGFDNQMFAATANGFITSTTLNTVIITRVGAGNGFFYVDGIQQSGITLMPDVTYLIDQSDSSNDGHPLILSTTTPSQTEYSTGVIYLLDNVVTTYANYVNTTNFNAATTRQVRISLNQVAPTLYYVCSIHQGMGGDISRGGDYVSWNLTGDSGTTEVIANGNTVDVAGGTDITTEASSADTLTVNHAAISRTDTTSTNSPAAGASVDLVKSLTVSTQGHVTAIDVSTVTWPAAAGPPTKTVDTATIANATTGTFTLTVTPSSENYVDMYISGVYQSKTTYTVAGTTVTLDGGTFFPNGAVVETVTTT